MTGVYMSLKNQKDLDIVYQVLRGEITVKDAAFRLQKSYRQALRIVEKVRQKGILGVKHGNLGKSPANRTDSEFKAKVLKIYQEQYFDYNMTHFLEKLLTIHQIKLSYETFRPWAHEINLVKRRHKNNKPKIHRTRPRMPKSGMLLQLDGSHHDWFGNGIKCCLVGNIDDATSTCPYAEFFPGEDRISVLTVMKETIEKFGVPEYVYLDQAACNGKDGIFRRNARYSEHITDLERALLELGCRLLFAPSPQAKGRIERMWNTFQDRLIPELRSAGVKRIPTANLFLQERFIPEFNRKFSKTAQQAEQAWRPLTETERSKMVEIFCMREYRKISMGETVSWNATTYEVHHDFNASLRRMTIEIRTYLDGKSKAYYAGREIELVKSSIQLSAA